MKSCTTCKIKKICIHYKDTFGKSNFKLDFVKTVSKEIAEKCEYFTEVKNE